MNPHSQHISPEALQALQSRFEGDLYADRAVRTLYATDASAYRELPVAVAFPRHEKDLAQLIAFAREQHLTLVPRSGGTSLAGQTVGHGLVVDVSKYMNRIVEVNAGQRWVTVEPGVVLEELNRQLRPLGLFFAPETSTQNRCTIGGMVGNNSCGTHALIYGSTRDHVLEVRGLLASGEPVCFGAETADEFQHLMQQDNHNGRIHRFLYDLLSVPANRQEIDACYPDPDVRRRNNGYALDALCHTAPFEADGAPFNLSRLMAGSEGTLMLLSRIKLHLEPCPAPVKLLSCVHLHCVDEAIEANLTALRHHPTAVELMDRTILECTRQNLEQAGNRFFIQGDPGALLIAEFTGNDLPMLEAQAGAMEAELARQGLGYHYARVTGSRVSQVWALRKAGLGVLSNIPGDAKPVSVIEDTAVAPKYLSAYLHDLDELMARHNLQLVYHGHISTGELHLRPMLNLKKSGDVQKFREIASETARLVRKYRGSLSGEHGDGRLRGEFIPLMYGQTIYHWFKALKDVFDPDHLFNDGKITDTPAMNTSLRYVPDAPTRHFDTAFDFSDTQGLMRAVEKCNGAGDCRKPASAGGLMCPSYKALRDEWASTRGRANLLREVLTHSTAVNPFDNADLLRLMDTCLMCKGCRRECPSNIDMTRLKEEFLFQYYRSHWPSLRTWCIAHTSRLNALAAATRTGTACYNGLMRLPMLKKLLKIAPGPMPALQSRARRLSLLKPWLCNIPTGAKRPGVFLAIDEFARDYFPEVAAQAAALLDKLGYHVVPVWYDSARALLSKGMLHEARHAATHLVTRFAPVVSARMPLVGLEPSCILGFRDEYPGLVPAPLRETARALASCTFTFDGFFMREVRAGRIGPDAFVAEAPVRVLVHGHCHQKALIGDGDLCDMLRFPGKVTLQYIPSGCCGMAGSFGYEAEHAGLSKQIGELVLFPAVRKAEAGDLIVAPGFSCRHHIGQGTGRQAIHPVAFMYLRLCGISCPQAAQAE